jgi:hypothetical protein
MADNENTQETQVEAAPAPLPVSGEVTAEQLAKDFKKDELKTAAQVQGVEVESGAKKADIAEALADNAAQSGPPIVVDNKTRRSGDDPLFGSWVDVVDGEHAGRFGYYVETVSHATDGYPNVVAVQTRDADNIRIEVPYSAVRPSERNGGR